MTFFIDRSLGGRIVAAALHDAGFEVIAHDDAFAPDTTDEVWLAHAGSNGWIVLMKDDRIRYRPAERAALEAAAACAFVLVGGNLTGDKQAELLVQRADEIRRFHAEYAGPYVIGVYAESPFLRKLYPRRRLMRRKERRHRRRGPASGQGADR